MAIGYDCHSNPFTRHPDSILCDSFQGELAYCKRKLDAGADGLFSQPFFDVEMARIYLDQLKSTSVFVGMSPVITEKSLNYWKTVNNVIFPDQFDLALSANCKIGRGLMQLARDYTQHTYSMPIRMDPDEYLAGLF